MSRFRFVALDGEGVSHRGILDAASAQAAMMVLSSSYPLVTNLQEVRPARLRRWFSWVLSDRVRGEDLLAFTHELSSVLAAGLSLKAALEMIAADMENVRFSEVIVSVGRSVQEGSSLAQALASHSEVFPVGYVSLVRAGEGSGTLPEMLERLAHQLEVSEALVSRVKAAFYYPMVVLLFATLLATVITAVAVPMLKGVYATLGRSLPLPTRLLLLLGEGLARHWLLLLVAAIASLYVVVRFARSPFGSWWLDVWRLRIPLLGSLLRNLAIARFSRNFGTVFGAGIPILQALDLTAGTAGSPVLERSIRASIGRIEEGNSLSQELRAGSFFTSLAVGMVAAGESCGTLDAMLEKLATFYEGRVETSLRALTSLVEPALMIGVGVLLGGLILALGLPFLSLGTVGS